MYLLTIPISLVICPFRSFAPLFIYLFFFSQIFCPLKKIRLFFFYHPWVVRALSVSSISTLCDDLQIFFFPVYDLAFRSLKCLVNNRSSHFWWSLSISAFMECAFGVLSKKPLPQPRSQTFSPVSPVSCIVLGFTFRSGIHFELIFVSAVMMEFKFIFKYRRPHIPAPFVEMTLLSLLYCLITSVAKQLTIHVYIIFRPFFSTFLCVYPLAIYTLPRLYSFVGSLRVGSCEFSHSVLFQNWYF